MAQDPIRQYSDAVTELERARGQVRQLQEIIGKMFSYLDNPYELMISNVDVSGKVHTPQGLVLEKMPTFSTLIIGLTSNKLPKL